MRHIIPVIPNEFATELGDPAKIASSNPLKISSFRKLVEVVAKFAYHNKDYLLFFRGQSQDYLNKGGSSSFYPSIYRADYLSHAELRYRFDILDGCSKALAQLFEENKIDGYKEIKRRKLIQWSIIQHYEVCSTPLLDFTQSLRVACSFAYLNNNSDKAFVFMFGLPYLTNRISLNSEHDIVTVRLLSICPPEAYRPHFQEGYLAGTDEIRYNYDKKSELDFNNRLIVKFELPHEKKFWGRNFHKIPKVSLYPRSDPIKELCGQISDMASRELRSGDLGDFLKIWSEIEEIVTGIARKEKHRHLSFRQALNNLINQYQINKNLYYQLDRIRMFRNHVVHRPKDIEHGEILKFLQQAEEALAELKKQIKFEQ